MDLYKHETTKIKSLLKNNPRGMSVTDISKNMGVNRNTVAKYLELLRISGHIEMENIGTAKVYFLSQRIPVSTLLNFSSDHIVVIDDNNRVVQTNDRFIDFTNLSKNEVQGKKITDILPPMISNKTFMDRINDARSGYQQIGTFDFFVDNELCFFKTKLIPSTFDDGENGITLIMENITEEMNSRNFLKRQQERLEILVSQRTSELEEANKMLKKEISDRKNIEEELRESEKKYRLLADNTFDSIWQLNEDLVFTYANPATMEINHFEAEDFIGTKLHDHFPDSEMKKMMDIMSQKFKNGSDGEYARIETVIYDKNKNLIPIEIYAKRLFDENGKFCGYQGTTKKRTV